MNRLLLLQLLQLCLDLLGCMRVELHPQRVYRWLNGRPYGRHSNSRGVHCNRYLNRGQSVQPQTQSHILQYLDGSREGAGRERASESERQECHYYCDP